MNKESEMNFDEDISIDDKNLIYECQRQPKTYKAWADIYVDSKTLVKKRKHNYEIVRAETVDDIRSNPQKYHLSRVTDKNIEHLVTLNNDVREAFRALLDAEHKSDVLSYAIKALEQKKDSLNNMVKISLSDWYSNPLSNTRMLPGGVESIKRTIKPKVGKNG